MSMSSIPSHSPSGKLYGWVERIGNKVPHPFLLFIYLIVIYIYIAYVIVYITLFYCKVVMLQENISLVTYGI